MRRPAALSYVRVRVTAAATLAALLVATIGSLLFVNSLRNALEQGLASSANEQVQSVRAQLASGASPARAVLSGKNDIVVQVIGPDGTVVASDHPRLRTPMRTTAGSERGVQVRGLADSYNVVARRARSGDLLIAVGRSEEGVERALEAVGVLVAVSMPVGLALLAGVVWLSIGRALRPVESMRREASEITSAHLAARLAVPPGGDEIPRLASTLNQMIDRIEASSRLQRQFVSDASHELRSPLAALRQLAEVARDYPQQTDTDTLARDVLAEELRMEELVTALLLLARIDDEVEQRQEPIDLDDIVLEEVRRARGLREDVHLAATQVGAVQLEGDPVLLRQVVRNLLTNAVRHAAGEVAVSLTEVDERAQLLVEDDGNGVPPEERDRIFQRFVRLDESRTRDAGGSGLGLAIVDKVVGALGGTASVGESRAGGAAFEISLPLGASPD